MVYLLMLLAFLADRASKWWAAAYLAEHGPTQVNAFFTLVETYNRGIAFGMFQGVGRLVGWLTLAVLAGLFVYLHRLPRHQWLSRMGLAILIGGASGNLVDRLFVGEVLDFIQTPLPTGVFNLSDVLIYVGLALVMVGDAFQGRQKAAESRAMKESTAPP